MLRPRAKEFWTSGPSNKKNYGAIECGSVPVRGLGPGGPRASLVHNLSGPRAGNFCTRLVRSPCGPGTLYLYLQKVHRDNCGTWCQGGLSLGHESGACSDRDVR